MKNLRELLKERYLTPIKENPHLYLGVELEFPIVQVFGQATDPAVGKSLIAHLEGKFGFESVKVDSEGQVIELSSPDTEDVIMFELTYNTLELAFGKADRIGQIDQRFQLYLAEIQSFLGQYDHALAGLGINPAWAINDNRAVKVDRYQMLLSYLALYKGMPQAERFHTYPDYGSFICGNQVQFDVSKANYLRVLNAFNKIEAAKAYLFANSPFEGEDWGTSISRDLFWENSMHGLFKKNIGIYEQDFQTEEDFLDYLEESCLFYVYRNGEILYFPPIQLKDYIDQVEIEAFDLSGKTRVIQPETSDLDQHRAYYYELLTTRGTVECRSVCTQALDKTFTPIAFQLGLLVKLDALERLLASSDFFELWGRDYAKLRRQFASNHLSKKELESIRDFSQELCHLAKEGLQERGFGEEVYLENLV